ncbi:MAG: fatty acid desaturase [Gloeobacteraceae cyanobacterium ES-bin-144]|nr:fatty acid desaturase [Verrucomicrobiales bacterium]
MTIDLSINSDSEPHWVSRSAFQIVIIMFLISEVAMVMVLRSGASLWFALPLMLVISHLMHGAAVGFHEASHGLLRRNRRFNEFDGVLIGLMSFMSFSLYRAAHQSHHAHFATERDEELWPFVITTTPRWARLLAAFLELTCGLVFTPFLFFRTFLRKGSPIRSRKVRRRIWAELLLMVVVWISIISAVAWFDVWSYFLWMYLLPTFVAGNLQSWRKYIEHVGLTGSTVNSATRSIVAQGWPGRLFAFTLLHEPFHGLHHLHVGLPHAELPALAPELAPKTADEIYPFPSYRSALLHLLRGLADPRVGAQWHNSPLPR